MEILDKYGTEAQKQKWLVPLLEGKIRSAFLMTEPDIASSDARNIRCDMRRYGDEYVLNGSVCIALYTPVHKSYWAPAYTEHDKKDVENRKLTWRILSILEMVVFRRG